ncbi:response regulator transcription factor [Chitinophaga sp.]|uniref:response regulator n=1 Tax=Chitinophaga sp. TaxID=1869181 RepID=UPI00261DE7AE|nr:response regulator transcription factor [uncultured Chitinophaga sp.]
MEIRIGIADDHLLIINGLETMLQSAPGHRLIFKALTGAALLEALEQEEPDVLLLDIQLPDANGVELCKQISDQFPDVRVIALTNHEETMYVRKMMRNGALGYLLKSTDPGSLLEAITRAYEGEEYLDKRLEKAMLSEMIMGKRQSGREVQLTKREIEILTLIASEHTNQQIADKLFISLRTVECHRLNITQKLNVKHTAGLVKEAYLRGLVK